MLSLSALWFFACSVMYQKSKRAIKIGKPTAEIAFIISFILMDYKGAVAFYLNKPARRIRDYFRVAAHYFPGLATTKLYSTLFQYAICACTTGVNGGVSRSYISINYGAFTWIVDSC